MADIPVETKNVKVEELFRDDYGRPFRGIPEEVEVVTKRYAKERMNKHLRIISLNHGRSVTQIINPEAKTHAFWVGQLPADKYGDTNIKGTSMVSEPFITPSTTDELGIHTHGLMDQDLVDRTKRASQVMRENGLPTEYIRGVKLLKEVITTSLDGNKQAISVDGWKKRQIDKINREIAGIDDTEQQPPYMQQFYANATKYLTDVEYVALIRDVQIDTRLLDIQDGVTDFVSLQVIMKPIFKWLNTVMKFKNEGLIPGTPKCTEFTTNEADIIRYFGEYYPSQIGIYLGKFRQIRLASCYLHMGNLQGVPTILDLDSVWGPLVYPDDPVPTENDFVEDFSSVITGLYSIWNSFKDKKIFGPINYNQIISKVFRQYISNYIDEAFNTEEAKLTGIENILIEVNKSGDNNIYIPLEAEIILAQIKKKLKRSVKPKWKQFFEKS